MLEFVDYLLGSICLSAFFISCGKYLFNGKIDKSLKFIIITIILIFIIMVNYMSLTNVARTMVAYMTILIVYRILFTKSILKSAIASLISYVLIALGEVLFIAIISGLSYIGISVTILELIGGFFANLIISLVSYLLLLFVYRPLRVILNKVRDYNRITLIFTFILLVTANCTLLYKVYFHKYKVDSYLILNLVLLVALSFIAFILIKQQYDKSKLSDEYEKYVEYSKQSEKLVNQYSISQHENKNELIVIRSMVRKNNKELINYLDEIITSKDKIAEVWVREIRYLPFGGLKGFVHNKISEMKDNGVNVFLNISKSVENSILKELNIKQNNQLLKIIGVFLDNAREAAMFSKEKEVSINVYTNETGVVFEIANTYINDIDFSKIYKIGNTNKGKGRGYGLALVDVIVSENSIFENEVKKIDNYFMQVLKINNKKNRSN